MTACMHLWECLPCRFLRWCVIIRWEPVSAFFEGTVLFSFMEMIFCIPFKHVTTAEDWRCGMNPYVFALDQHSMIGKKNFLDIQRFNQLEVLKTTFSQVVTIPFERWQVPSTVAKRRDA